MLNIFEKEEIRISDGKNFKLKSLKTSYETDHNNEDSIKHDLLEITEDISDLQDKLFAQGKHSVLLVLQAIDAAGKDSCIKKVFSGVNPQGIKVVNFKQPSKEELAHDFLWRINKNLPERGMIHVFNRSHYEEVIVTKVHPEFILGQNIPNINSIADIDEKFWENRYKTINHFEKHLIESGTIIIKVFLNLNKTEQKNRFMDRIETPKKNWKFNASDLKERKLWDNYQNCYEEMIKNTSSKNAPWFVVPSDNQWISRLMIGEIVLKTLQSLDLEYPKLSEADMEILSQAKIELDAES